MEEIKKSIAAILYERTTSPLFGTLILSWIIWNWKIIYLTFFISETKIKETKIDYIITNYSDIEHIVTYPLISTFLLLTVVPFISNGAFWLSLNFNKWKVDKKNIIDSKQLLTIEQSIELREEISKQEERFAKLVENKNLEITQLNTIIEEINNKKLPREDKNNIIDSGEKTTQKKTELEEFAVKLKNSEKEYKEYENIVNYIQKGYTPVDKSDVSSKLITLLESYNIIERNPSGSYTITADGKKFYRMINK